MTGLPQNPCTGLVFKRARLRGSTPGHATRISKNGRGRALVTKAADVHKVQVCASPSMLMSRMLKAS